MIFRPSLLLVIRVRVWQNLNLIDVNLALIFAFSAVIFLINWVKSGVNGIFFTSHEANIAEINILKRIENALPLLKRTSLCHGDALPKFSSLFLAVIITSTIEHPVNRLDLHVLN